MKLKTARHGLLYIARRKEGDDFNEPICHYMFLLLKVGSILPE